MSSNCGSRAACGHFRPQLTFSRGGGRWKTPIITNKVNIKFRCMGNQYLNIFANQFTSVYRCRTSELRRYDGKDGRGSIPGMGGFCSSPQRPKGPWRPPSLLSNGYCVYSARSVKLPTHFHLVPRSRAVELYLHYTRVSIAWCLITQAQGQLFLLYQPSWGHAVA
jgi:hypothetical protein